MDITPHTNLLKSLRGERIDYVLLIGEGIDNALDAGAKHIEIDIDEETIEFRDNGDGVLQKNISALFSLGEHGAMTTTQLGRFGVGIKSQAINAGDRFTVMSISKDGRVSLDVNWRKILRSGRWFIDDPRWLPVIAGTKTGTTITISDLRPRPAVSTGKLIEKAALMFFPAIVEGREIIINGHSVPLPAEPEMTDVIDQKFTLSGQRSAHLRAGILAAPSKLNQVHVGYKHRVIMPASSLGCSGYSGLTKMFARVQLDGPWHFAKFKNDITDEEERDELEDTISEALKPILEKCNTASMSARINALSTALNEMIPPEMAGARPRRQKLGEQEAKENNRRQHGMVSPEKSDAASGPARARRPRRDTLIITFDGIAEEHGIGIFQEGLPPQRPHRVNLSKEDPYIKQLMEHRDQHEIEQSLFAIAMAIFVEGRNEQQQPELMLGDFGKRIAILLAMQNSKLEREGIAG